MRPHPDERGTLLAVGGPYFSRGSWDDRLGRIAVLIDATTDWAEIAELLADSCGRTAPEKLVARPDAVEGR